MAVTTKTKRTSKRAKTEQSDLTELAESNRRLEEEIADRGQAEADLAIANQILEAKHQELQGRNIALQQVLSRIEEEKGKLAFLLRSNLDRLVKPIVRALEDKAGPAEKRQLRLLSACLDQAAAPLNDKLQSTYAILTPREVEIANMVKNGLTSKQAGGLLGLSEATVRKHRRNIRRKLDIAGKQQNLSSFLKTL
jgi:DNA-binding CsgD family transcriptional regulator